MKYIKKLTLVVLSVMVLFGAVCYPVSAASPSASIAVNFDSVNIGDTVTATFNFTASETIYGVKMNGTYNPSILKFVSSDSSEAVVSGGNITVTIGGGSSTTLSFSVRFTAIAAGECKLSVDYSELLGLQGEIGYPTADKTINVKNPSESSNITRNSGSNVSNTTNDDDISIDGIIYKLTNHLSGVNIPNGFEEASYIINGKEIPAFKHKTVNMVLVCLNNGSLGNKLFVYDQESNTFSNLLELTFKDRTYIVVNDYIPQEISENYIKTSINIQDLSVNAWHIENSDLSDFYLLYLINQEGDFGLYQYDSIESTMQRYIITPVDDSELVSLEAENESLSNSLKTSRIVGDVFIVLSSLLIILLFVGVVISKKNRSNKN